MSFSSTQIPRAEADRNDGTENHARVWARLFYTKNTGFLRGNCRTRQALAYFFKVWSCSDEARHAIDEEALGFTLEPRNFSQVLFALAIDGKVCHIANRDQRGRPHKKPVIIWHRIENSGTPQHGRTRDHTETHDTVSTKQESVTSSVTVTAAINRAVSAALDKYKEENSVKPLTGEEIRAGMVAYKIAKAEDDSHENICVSSDIVPITPPGSPKMPPSIRRQGTITQ